MSEFEPRRAEPGQEFGYTVPREDTTVSKERYEKEDFEAPGELTAEDVETGARTYSRFGVQRTLKADAEGVVRPQTAADVALLDTFDLPVARKAIEADKSDSKSGGKSGGAGKES